MSSDFADLARDRKVLKDFCKLHVPSVLKFKSGRSFKLNLAEPDFDEDLKLHHLTSSSTCIESIVDCPEEFLPEELNCDKKSLGLNFAIRAIRRTPARWISEGSAEIYCKCRALPFVIHHLPRFDGSLKTHLETIIYQLRKPDRFAIGEAAPTTDDQDWYPANAFHTYWFLSTLQELENTFASEYRKLARVLKLSRLKDQMLLWARAVAGRQISLHVSKSSTLDSDQLAWSLAIFTKFASDFQSNLSDQDFLRQGFAALFAEQTPSGTWQHGRPLFHYKKAGNAYCYVYETFTILLKNVLERKNEGEFLRTTLWPFLPNLMNLWKYALSTQIPLPVDPEKPELKLVGWSSGHRMEQPFAESWATASVFSYAQALRRLIGVRARERAMDKLNEVVTFNSLKDADKSILERGTTWSWAGSRVTGVGEELTTLFVNPCRRVGSNENMEPDTQPIGSKQARSAILFGPPGTSKTHLARSVAGAIGWKYVEVHASHFVSAGLPEVQRTADEIFDRLMELDHTVILFDEIDELVRERDVEPDAFGRFLTTSMLPKLAELWEQRKVIYFIATNHIEYFDRAVTRAQRFDALIFVAPPSFNKKIQELYKLIKKQRKAVSIRRTVSERQINAALDNVDCTAKFSPEASLAKAQLLAKFIMLRWDQLEELAVNLIDQFPSSVKTINITAQSLQTALDRIADPSLQFQKTYCDFKKASKYSMKDFGKEIVWQVSNLSPKNNYSPPLEIANDKVWLPVRDPENLKMLRFKFAKSVAGKLKAIER